MVRRLVEALSIDYKSVEVGGKVVDRVEDAI